MLMQEFSSAYPEVYQALGAIGKAVGESGLERPLIELVKLRSAQINGCAYCLSFHTGLAKKLRLAPAKLELLSAWRDAGVFDERERAALAWTEALTRMADSHPGSSEEAAAREQFGEKGFVNLTIAIGLINQWNRICGGLKILAPEAVAEAAQVD
jgi:AhpD family alkylhydroperoxidase